jgi:predicted tellurium resistance membrane protein TerC
MSKKIQEKAKPLANDSSKSKVEMVLGKQNYIITGLAFLVVIIGFILMYGGKEDIYSFRKITLAPIVVIAGFLIGVYAIMYKPKKSNDTD